MMSLIAQLCALCAMSALVQMVLPDHGAKGSLRVICGLMMQYLTLSGLKNLGVELAAQQDLAGILSCLMK